jgi:hypothetical protein
MMQSEVWELGEARVRVSLTTHRSIASKDMPAEFLEYVKASVQP